MPRTEITVSDLLPRYGASVKAAKTTPDNTNGNEALNAGFTFLVFQNQDTAASKSVSIPSKADEYGRTEDISITVAAAASSTAQTYVVAGLFKPQHFNDGNGRSVAWTGSATGLRQAAYKFSK